MPPKLRAHARANFRLSYEQVRQAVETLLNEVNQAVRGNPVLLDKVRFSPHGAELPQRRVLEALYQAATRIIMRW